MKLRGKLIALASAPLILALAFGSAITIGRFSDRRGAQRTVDSLDRLASLSRLLGAVQDERGKSTLFLAGGIGKGELLGQCTHTDTAIEGESASLAGLGLGQEVAEALSPLAGIRSNTLERKLLGNTSFNQYSSIIDGLTVLVRNAAASAPPEFARDLLGLVLLEESKEYAERSQAKISSTLALDVGLSDEEVIDIVSNFVSIKSDLESALFDGDWDFDVARTEILKSTFYDEIEEAVLDLVRLSDRGAYGRDGNRVFTAAGSIIKSIQSAIDERLQSTTTRVEAQLKADSNAILIAAGSVGIAVLVVLLLTVLVLRAVMRRISALSTAFEDIAKGEGDLTACLDAGKLDEIGALACNFNDFSASLREIVNRVKSSARSLAVDMEELSTNTSETAAAVEEIAATIESIRSRAEQQGESVAASSTATQEIGKRIGALVIAVERQTESLSASSASIEEMVANIRSVSGNLERMGRHFEQLKETGGAGRLSVGRASSTAREIEEKSESLRDANALIAGIAAQTNLLAMNAAIEAAHAGEAGQGFSVVADEIRKLAERSARQSKTVAGSIEEIRWGIGAVVEAAIEAERGFSEMSGQIDRLAGLESELSYAMKEQSEGSNQVLEGLSTMNSLAGEVRSQSERMRDESGRVLEEMKRLLGLSTELERGMSEMAVSASQIRGAASDTRNLSLRASDKVKELAADMDHFKTE